LTRPLIARARTRARETLLLVLTAAAMLSGGAALGSEGNAELSFHRGVVAFDQERMDDARGHFEEVLATDPQDTSAIQYLALIAHAQGDPEQAIVLYRQALLIDPNDVEIRLDLGISLLEIDELSAAREQFDAVLAVESTRARAQLLAGITAYRSGDYAAALPYLDRAAALDPSVRTEARYYTGLCQVLLQRYELADGALSDVEQQAPVSPLGQSARQLREQMRERPDDSRRWWLALSLGLEGDSNPTVAGAPLSRDPDGRVVLRPQAEYTLWQQPGDLVSVGYDGYLSFHFDEHEVDLNTHSAFLQGSTSLGPVQATLRYDYAATWIDLSQPFRQLHRIIPSVSFPIGEVGVTQVYYQWLHHDFDDVFVQALDRSGNQNVIAANHFFFIPTDYTDYIRIGALGDFYNADGSEYTYRGWEVSFGISAPLPFEFNAVALYRYIARNYRNRSICRPNQKRNDSIHRVGVDFVRPIGQDWELSLTGTFNWVDSNIPAFDFNRFLGGAYITYLF
jgi:tetratricopeptide (TPR) repeat protein